MIKKMKLILILSLFLIFGKTVSAELSHDDWVGLWIGEGQIGDFPDFGIFSLGDDYLLISSFDGENSMYQDKHITTSNVTGQLVVLGW